MKILKKISNSLFSIFLAVPLLALVMTAKLIAMIDPEFVKNFWRKNVSFALEIQTGEVLKNSSKTNQKSFKN